MFSSHPKARLIEWQHSLIFLLLGIVLVMPFGVITSSIIFTSFLKILPVDLLQYAGNLWGAVFMIIGFMRIVLLFLERLNPTRPVFIIGRMLMCFVYMLFLGFFVTAFIVIWPAGLWAAVVYFILMVFEIIVLWRATRYLKNLVRK